VSIVRNSHCIKLILHIPLKSADRHFKLYKIIILPERISSGKLVQYAIECSYLATQVIYHGYIPFTEKDYSKCATSTITVCALDSAMFNTQRLTVPLAYFSRVKTANNCVREIYFQQSTMIRHPNIRVYHFPTPHHLTLGCPGNEASPPSTQVLVNAGLLFNASACHVSTENLRIYPTLRGSMQTEFNTRHISLPDKVPIVTQHEYHQLHELTPPILQELDSYDLISQTLCIQWSSIPCYTCTKLHENVKQNTLAHNCYLDYYYFVIRIIVYSTTSTLRQTTMCHYQNTR